MKIGLRANMYDTNIVETIELDPITVDFSTAERLTTEVVRELGEDFVYHKECVYAIEGEESGWSPGCIVGQVLHRSGLDSETLRKLDLASATIDEFGQEVLIDGTGVKDLRSAGVLNLDNRTAAFLQAAQTTQDARSTYGEALADAKKAAEAIAE